MIKKSPSIKRAKDRLARLSLASATAISIVTTIAIVFVLGTEAWGFFAMPEVSVADFLFGTKWSPLLGNEKHFGIWPLICGTLLVTAVAASIAIPCGVVTAIFLAEYAPSSIRNILKPVLEILAGVPSVVYGFFALTVITPMIQTMIPGVDIYNALSAGIAVGIMCIPIVTSMSEDAIQSVPDTLREGSFALGGTKLDTSIKVVFPAALSGVVSSCLLSIARAVGETMIVALAAGNLAQLTLNPGNQVQTMTAYMVQIFLGDTDAIGVEYKSSYAVAATLFVMTLLLTWIGHSLSRKYKEVYS
ncbi:MAG: phosphate ABC transporter permease subunit PstC [Planctomycetes bacterium]|nr:phosphate ABC transporter permease subunit PstC [Planctomycetota bacterium]